MTTESYHAAPKIQPDNIPAELRALPQWVCWRSVSKGGKPTKIPYTTTGKLASTTDAATWASFDVAVAAYQAGGYSGTGFVFSGTDGYCGVDLDYCILPDGTLEPWAAQIVEDMASYSEVSPSDTGIKIFIKAVKPGSKSRAEIDKAAGQHVEIYDKGRYFTVTGNVWPGTPAVVQDRQPELNELYAGYFPESAAPKPHRPMDKAQPDTNAPQQFQSPHWPTMAERVRRCRLYTDKIPGGVERSNGSGPMLQVACETQRFALDDCAAWQIMLDYAARCTPPWKDVGELRHKFESARQKTVSQYGSHLNEPNGKFDTAGGAESTTVPPAVVILPNLSDVADIGDDADSELGPVVIDGILRERETMNIIAPSKLGKTFLVIALAICKALGLKWLGVYQCTASKVLVLDNELHPRTLRHRLKMVCRAMEIDPEQLRGKLFFETFRGRLVKYDRLGPYMKALAGQGFGLIILDAHYRFSNGDENSNDEATNTYNLLDSYADTTGAALALIHHSSKGIQTEKSVTDVGSGAGAQSRAVDTHLVLRAHEEPGKAVMEACCRTWPTPTPMTLRYEYPVWTAEPETEPVLKTLRGKKKTTADDASDAPPGYMAILQHAGPEPKPVGWFAAKACGGKEHAARSLLRQAVAVGALHLWPAKKARDFERWATVPPGVL